LYKWLSTALLFLAYLNLLAGDRLHILGRLLPSKLNLLGPTILFPLVSFLRLLFLVYLEELLSPGPDLVLNDRLLFLFGEGLLSDGVRDEH
jgi:hypothetical protein